MKLPAHVDLQRVFACLLVILQSVALGHFFRTTVFSLLVISLVLLGTWRRFRWISPQIIKWLPVVLPVLYGVQRMALPDARPSDATSFLFPGAGLIAKYFVSYQLAMFFVDREQDRLPGFLPILAIMGIVFTGDVRVDDAGRLLFQVFALLLVLFSIGFFVASTRSKNGRSSSPPRLHTWGHTWSLVAVIAVCSMTAWASASGLYRYAREIETTFNRFINPSRRPDSIGFSGMGRIGSVAQQKGTSADHVALRVFAAETPGYLRGKSFDIYARGQWRRTERRTMLDPIVNDELTAGVSQNPLDRYFRIDLVPTTSRAAQRLDVWPVQRFREVLFTPLQTIAIQAPVHQLLIDANDVVSADDLHAGGRYRVWRTKPRASETRPASTAARTLTSARTLTPAEHARYTALPANLDRRIGALASSVVGEAVTTADKLAAIISFFHEHYEYRFGIDIPTQRDPVEYFLLERPPAHCEYFASGAAMLLRSVDVPCRYVTGLVAAEPNSIGDYWVARNRDAHAWVEAFDPERGWVIVETTPPSGVPDSTSSSWLNQSQDAVRSKWQRMMAMIGSLGAGGVLAAAARFLIHPIALLLYSLFASVFILRRVQRRRRWKAKFSVDPQVAQLHGMLSRMDGRWQRNGLIRQPHETLHQFAIRIESSCATPEHTDAAQWYRRFAALRYGGSIDDHAINLLDAAATTSPK